MYIIIRVDTYVELATYGCRRNYKRVLKCVGLWLADGSDDFHRIIDGKARETDVTVSLSLFTDHATHLQKSRSLEDSCGICGS